MKLIDIFKSKANYLYINIIIFFILCIFFKMLNMSYIFLFIVFFIWFTPLIGYMLIESLKLKKYFNKVEHLLEELDKKYLFPEVLEKPNLIEGEFLNEIMAIVGRDMYENIKYYKDEQLEYREYIESWVHEIKTPIASIKMISENHQNEYISKINSQVDKIENFIEQALYYARSNDVEKDYIVKKMKLYDSVVKIIKRNSKDFISKKIKLEIEDFSDTEVYSDTKWIEFIINQILQNAIKYSKHNESKIIIKTEKHSDSIILSITDNGIGISKKDISRVFEKGFTGENGRLLGSSTGIGLYLCKKLSLKLGIGLELTSEKNIGTTVKLIFPVNSFVIFN